MIKVVGIDLAGLQKNPTGICYLTDRTPPESLYDSSSWKRRNFSIANVETLYYDDEIVQKVFDFRPMVVGIDAPISIADHNLYKTRECDVLLRKYGALPLELKGMTKLAKRGERIARRIAERVKTIEVFPTATAKILGIYDKDKKKMQNSIKNIGIKIDAKELSEHEIDAIIAGLTALLYIEKKTIEVGNEKVIIPKV